MKKKTRMISPLNEFVIFGHYWHDKDDNDDKDDKDDIMVPHA